MREEGKGRKMKKNFLPVKCLTDQFLLGWTDPFCFNRDERLTDTMFTHYIHSHSLHSMPVSFPPSPSTSTLFMSSHSHPSWCWWVCCSTCLFLSSRLSANPMGSKSKEEGSYQRKSRVNSLTDWPKDHHLVIGKTRKADEIMWAERWQRREKVKEVDTSSLSIDCT